MPVLDSTSHGLVVIHIVCASINTAAVILRFIAKNHKRISFSWDDGFMLLAWATVTAFIGTSMKCLSNFKSLETMADLSIAIYLGGSQMSTVKLSDEAFTLVYKVCHPGHLRLSSFLY